MVTALVRFAVIFYYPKQFVDIFHASSQYVCEVWEGGGVLFLLRVIAVGLEV